MLRREFIAGLAGTTVSPFALLAQPSAIPVIGLLTARSAETSAGVRAAFLKGLSETGFVEGRNVQVEYRWADGKFDRLQIFVGDLVDRRVNVIAALGSAAPGRAAKAVTSVIPIVFQTGGDPVQDGLVASFNRPGGNVTGVSRMAVSLAPKLLALLKELLPDAETMAFLVNSSNPVAERLVPDMKVAGRSLGLELRVVNASTASELDAIFATLSRQRVGALIVANDPFFETRRDQLIALLERYAIAASYPESDFVAHGGLMSYGASLTDSWRQAGVYVGRILKGEKAAELPVVQPTKFELVINLKTAKALGLTIPETLLATADEVIQ
jgi:putative tryptophan/tyrosine transport system substrate-binding protein